MYRDFVLESCPVTRSATQGEQKNVMEAGMSNLEQSVKSVTDGQQEIREELRECMTELFDLLSTQGKSRQEE
jgi:hypothetical protein